GHGGSLGLGDECRDSLAEGDEPIFDPLFHLQYVCIARGVFYNFAGYELCCPREERSFLGLYGYFDWSEVCAPSPASVASMNERHLFAEELDVAFCRLEVDDVFAVFDVFGLHGSWFLVEAFAGCGVGAFAFVLFSRSLQKLERIEVF